MPVITENFQLNLTLAAFLPFSFFWLSEVSGVPFGVINELLLHRSINKGRGMIYAMVPRGDWGMWSLWKDFDITRSKMIGYRENHAPVRTNNNHVFVTSYVNDGAAWSIPCDN